MAQIFQEYWAKQEHGIFQIGFFGLLESLKSLALANWNEGASSRDAEVADLQRELAISQEVSDRHLKDAVSLQARIDRVKALPVEWMKDLPTGPFANMDADLEDQTLRRCSDELLRALEGE